jgi:hypothetical protein
VSITLMPPKIMLLRSSCGRYLCIGQSTRQLLIRRDFSQVEVLKFEEFLSGEKNAARFQPSREEIRTEQPYSDGG